MGYIAIVQLTIMIELSYWCLFSQLPWNLSDILWGQDFARWLDIFLDIETIPFSQNSMTIYIKRYMYI